MKTVTVNPLSKFEKDAIRWHLQNNLIRPCTEKVMDGVIKNINELRRGDADLSTAIFAGADVSIGEMLEDLKLTEYIP